MTKLKLQSLRNYRDESRKKLPGYTNYIEEIIALGEPEENGYDWIPNTNLSPEEYQEYMEAFNAWWLNQQTQGVNTPNSQ